VTREIEFAFSVPGGLHARPASLLRDAAARFRSAITLTNRSRNRTANAKSTLALVSTLTRHADACILRVEGDDEEAAAESLRRFLRDDLPSCEETPPASVPSPGTGGPLPRALAALGAKVFRGAPASRGIARARAFVLDPWRDFRGLSARESGSPAEEISKLDRAFAQARAELTERLGRTENETERAIVAAHVSIIDDPEFRTRAEGEIRSGTHSAGTAVIATAGHFAGILRESGSAILAERALDIRDIAAHLVRALYGGRFPEETTAPDSDSLCLAESLTPSQFLAFPKAHLRGIVLASGGRMSHTAILARASGIPCVTGASGIDRAVSTGQEVIVDGERGLVVVDPPPAVCRFYEAEMEKLVTIRARLEAFRSAPGRTADGRPIEVGANVASLEDVRLAFAGGAEGIGLFRTEFLFMNRREPPSEEEQFLVYSEAVRMAGGRPVIIRTLDVGGDKPIPYLRLPREKNPFLGYRAVRTYGEHEGVVAAQLRAILRASAFGKVKIMVPMVASVEEIRAVRALVRRLSGEPAREGVPHDAGIEVGAMIEIPSAAFALGTLAKEADFFSIGSNDLAQYFFAADRDNERVSHLYGPRHPAFLRLLKMIVDEARRAGRWVGLCGEMGRDPLAAPLLAGLGLDEVSLASPGIPAVKSALARATVAECRALLDEALSLENGGEVEALLRRFAFSKEGLAVATEGAVRLHSRSASREEAVRELVDLLHLAGRVGDPDRFEEAVWRREESSSTAVGFGVAIPHAKSREVHVTSIAILGFDSPLEWESADGEPVRMAILIAVPESAPDDAHLRLIASLSRRLMDDEFREALLSTQEEAGVVRLIRDAAS
jgi:fructose-specific PTS system IIA-like component